MNTEQVIAGCEGKIKHTRERAKVAAKRQRRKGLKVEEYKCRFCGGWHVGSSTAKETASAWQPSREHDRPTPERKKKGEWTWVSLEKGSKAPRDMHAHPIDRLEHSGQLTPEQAAAAYDYERLYRAAIQSPQARDSTLLWQPKGHESDDGNINAVRDRRELYLMLGMKRDKRLRWVCVEHHHPRFFEVGMLREALNECARFFGYGNKPRWKV